MSRRAVARRGVVQVRPLRLGVGEKFLEGVDRQHRRVDEHKQRIHRQHRHRCEIFHRVVAERHQVRIGGDVGVAAHHQRIAVGRGARHRFGADAAVRADAVLDHHRLADAFGELRADDARREIGAAAGGKGDDDADGAHGIVLRRCARCERQQEEKEPHTLACRKRSSRCAKNAEWLPASSSGSPIQKCGAPSSTAGRA
jgi:hypothetical protein